MPIVAHFQWKLVTELKSKAVAALPTLFNFSTGKTFIRTLGGQSNFAFTPQSLSPTNRFYDLLEEKATGLGFGGRKFPFLYTEDQSKNERSINARFRRYGKDLLVVELALRSFEVDTPADLIAGLDLWANDQLSSFANTLVGLVVSGEKVYRLAPQRPKIYPCVLVVAPRSKLPDARSAVELLTRHQEPDEIMVAAVLAKNRCLKIDASTLLIDRQGVVALVPVEHSANVTINRRFLAASNMLELMACVRKMIDQRKLHEIGKQGLAELAKAFHDPEQRFVHSTSSLHMWQLLADEFKLRADQWPVEIGESIDVAKARSQSAAVAPIEYSFYGNVGTVMTGPGAVAHVVHDIGTEQREAILAALQEVKQALLRAPGIPLRDQQDLLELAGDAAGEVAKESPNTKRLSMTLQSLASAVQGIASGQGAYEVLRAAAAAIGIPI